ncbi:MAG: S-layer homology domain-containing protein [Candidatus Abawacabacteria bacterium]|nr:S-layer homology domain-containing protein [Candidatus Abawacabacteria bacterium]
MKKYLQSFASVGIASLLLLTLNPPVALAQTASSAANALDDATQEVEDLRTDTSYDSSSDFTTTTHVENFFEELAGIVENADDEIRSVNRPITQADLNTVEDAYDDFVEEVEETLRVIDSRISTTSLQTAFNNAKNDLEDDEELNDLEEGFDALEATLTGGTSGSTSATIVDGVIEDIDEATDNVDDLRTDVDAITTSTLLDSFFEDLIAEAEDVVDALEKITGSISTANFDEIDESVQSFNDEVDERFDRLVTRTGSGGTITSLKTSFIDQRNEYRDGEEDDIDSEMDRIARLAFGTSAGSASVSSIINKIEGFEEDVESIEDEDATSINTETELDTYIGDIIEIVNDVETELKRITGTITQDNFDDIEDAVQNFLNTVDDARDAVEDNSTDDDYEEEFGDQEDELGEETDAVEEALDALETKIGTLNTPGTGNTSFIDVSSTSEFARFITALASRNIITGYSDRSFQPKRNITRAEFLKIALLSANKSVSLYQNSESTFKDVPFNHSLRTYVNYASANQIVNGFTVGGLKYFYPERSITRAEAVIILLRINGIAPGSASVSRFSDVKDLDQIRYIEVAASRNIVKGYSPTTFGPNDFITREQAAKVVSIASGLVTP